MNKRAIKPLKLRFGARYAFCAGAPFSLIICEDFIMSDKKLFVLGLGIALSLGLAVGCDDDDSKDADNGSGETTAEEGYLATCKKPDAKTPIYVEDDPVRSKIEAATYLAQYCSIPEYYTKDEFQNATVADQGIGASCFCFGKDCEYMKYERPEVGGIASQNEAYRAKYKLQQAMFGCDGVPETHNGAVRTCFRSSEVANIKPAIYFPYGTCALAMSQCNVEIEKNNVKAADGTIDQTKTAAQQKTSRDTICGFATFGDPSIGGEGADNAAYAEKLSEFTSCPSGDVLIDFVMPIEVTLMNSYADLNVRACFQGCKQDSDCHGFGVYDPIVKKQSGTKCVTVENASGAKAGVCFDPATVTGVEDSMRLVDAGNFAQE